MAAKLVSLLNWPSIHKLLSFMLTAISSHGRQGLTDSVWHWFTRFFRDTLLAPSNHGSCGRTREGSLRARGQVREGAREGGSQGTGEGGAREGGSQGTGEGGAREGGSQGGREPGREGAREGGSQGAGEGGSQGEREPGGR